LLGVHALSFTQQYEDKIKDFRRTFKDYVQSVRASARPGPGTGGTTDNKLIIEKDTDGYPIAPKPESWNKSTKEDLEKLYRDYITIHYRRFICRSRYNYSEVHIGLASGNRDRQAPFTRIGEKHTAFISHKYLPRNMELKDPRAMKRDQLIKFFKHIAGREASHGIKDGFKFKNVLSTRKKGEIRSAKYPGPAPDPEPALSPITDNAPNLDPTYNFSSSVGQAQTSSFQISLHPIYSDPQPIQSIHSAPAPVASTSALTYDPGHSWDTRIELDPSLDPEFDTRPSTNSHIRVQEHNIGQSSGSQWLTVPTPAEPAQLPANDSATNTNRSPRRRGQSAEQLAIEEAKKLIGKGKRRRR
jgi:hypothetical protein